MRHSYTELYVHPLRAVAESPDSGRVPKESPGLGTQRGEGRGGEEGRGEEGKLSGGASANTVPGSTACGAGLSSLCLSAIVLGRHGPSHPATTASGPATV